MTRVHTLIVWTAQYLLWVMVAVFVLVWLLREDRSGKIELGAAAVLGLILVAVFLYIAGHVHTDPRPFVENPGIKPLFGHSRDNGFPSDHCLAAGLIAVVVFIRHRLIGFVLALLGVAIAWARVAAHVHHLQDVVAGLLLGALAAALASLVVHLLLTRIPRLAAVTSSRQAATSRH